MEVKYVRVSSLEQNPARQDSNLKSYVDKCSGSIAFNKRPSAKKLLNDIDKITTVRVHSIDRMGRNTLDIMQTIQFFTNKGINVVSEKEGLSTIVDGKENPIAKMLVGILGTLAEFELARIRERQLEGVSKAKERGVYKTNGGNKQTETVEQFLSKAKNKKCHNYLKQGYSLRIAARLAGVSLGTASKVNKLRQQNAS